MDVPPELKSVNRYLRQAKKMDKIQPLVAYHCRLHAIETAMKVENKTAEVNSFLANLMGELEQASPEVRNVEKDSARQQVMQFALMVFKRADDEDRAGNTGKKTLQAFMAAHVFFEVLQHFGDVPEDVSDKHKYSMWKVKDIATAIKEGRKPTPGPPGGLPDDEQMDDEAPMDTSSTPGANDGGRISPDAPNPFDQPEDESTFPPPSEPAAFGNQQPAFQQPAFQQPAFQQPAPQQPAFQQPAVQQPASQQPSSSYTSNSGPSDYRSVEENVAIMTKCEKLLKQSISSLRFQDADTSIEKLQEIINMLRPASTRYR
eukprot:407084_1